MLELLFPEIGGETGSHIPKWQEMEKPWAILDDGSSHSLKSQIEEMVGKEGFFVHKTAKIGENVVIENGCYIGPGVEIRNCAYIRKGAWICRDSLVGHSTEIKNSILLPGAKAPHFNYVGDSVIGYNVNLGAGAKISNVRNDRRGVIVTVPGGQKIVSGMGKLGSMIGSYSQLGCNVVTNPGCIILPRSMIGPNEVVSGLYSN